VLSIAGANGMELQPVSVTSQVWSGELPSTQDYFLDLNAPTESVSDYTLSVTLENPSP
jgi:hypothetical protein